MKKKTPTRLCSRMELSHTFANFLQNAIKSAEEVEKGTLFENAKAAAPLRYALE